MELTVNVINAFSIDGKGGNPAGVVFDADKLTKEEKQSIATAAGFPETAFVSSSAVAGFKLDFFTPLKQIAHCGHATIATFSYLKKTGKIPADHSSKETIDGTRSIVFKNGRAFMEQSAPSQFIPSEDIDTILNSLHIDQSFLKEGLQPTIVNTGNSFLIIPVKDQQVLAEIDYDRDAVYRVSEKYGLIGYYVYAPANPDSGLDATTRMFAPFYGIEEEAGTGMAAGPLAAYLYQVERMDKPEFRIEQGRFMHPASPSLIEVNLDISGGQITRLFAGGDSYISGEKTISLK